MMKVQSKPLVIYLLAVLFLLFLPNKCCSQDSNSDSNINPLNKNVISATLGIDPGEFYGTLLGSYEQMIVNFQKSFVNSLWVKVGAGPWVWWSGHGTNYISTISMLTGRKKVHIETGAGVLFTYNSDFKGFRPLVHNRYFAGNIGFRYQKPGGAFAFRTGIGWPEFLYLSIGYCF
jgi:hypothetical protein